uniref:Short chain dehydrogenase n=1 Tax=Karlodinium veneficum TaxID=407301 RepID=A7YXV5_KARVE|nr:short chain dehydrogenase [Karlodinium veneficum]
MDLLGKKALVFGGTSGIGLAAARQLTKLGAKVIGFGRDPSKAAGESLEGLTFQKCDVLKRDELSAVFAEHAPFDILISAATGGERAIGPFLEMDLDGYQASFAKLWGYTNVVRLGTAHLSESGCIVLVSGAPARRAKPGQSALASVGGAVEQFVRAVAPELAPRRINVVSPGVIDTPMFGSESDEKKNKLAAMTNKNLIPRPGTSDEVAQGILFAVQNTFVTGTTIDVDGGWLHST